MECYFNFGVLWNKILLNTLFTELQVGSAVMRFPFNALELINAIYLLNTCNFIWVVLLDAVIQFT